MALQRSDQKRHDIHSVFETSGVLSLSEKMTLSQLNKDVTLEIFLQFVAIDWDGPFTLTLVCSEWREIVTSTAILWTWLMVDESQPDWRERIEIAACLSKDLPLNVVLRVPFTSDMPISHITRRCVTLFVDSRHLYHDPAFLSSQLSKMVSHETFQESKEAFQQINDAIVCFLGEGQLAHVRIQSEDSVFACFAYSAWHSYDMILGGRLLEELLIPGQSFLVTALVLKRPGSASLSSIQICITDLWEVLPLTPYLNYLELSDTLVKMQRTTVLPRMTLLSLHTLTIDCSIIQEIAYDEPEAGLFKALGFLEAPFVDSLALHGSNEKLTAILSQPNVGIRPRYLRLFVVHLEPNLSVRKVGQNAIWDSVERLSLSFQGTERGSFLYHIPIWYEGVRVILSCVRSACSVQLLGGTELDLLLRSDLLQNKDVNVVFTRRHIPHLGLLQDIGPVRPICSLTLGAACSYNKTWRRWICAAERVFFDDIPNTHEWLSFNDGRWAAMTWLDTGTSTLYQPPDRYHRGHANPGLSNLTSLRCLPEIAEMVVRTFEVKSLQTVTLCRDIYGILPSFQPLVDVLMERSEEYVQLTKMGVEGFAHISTLVGFIRRFRRPGGGISTLDLPGLPHPSVLDLLVESLNPNQNDVRADVSAAFIADDARNSQSSCVSCLGSGWECFYQNTCTRFSGDTISIHQGTSVGIYSTLRHSASLCTKPSQLYSHGN